MKEEIHELIHLLTEARKWFDKVDELLGRIVAKEIEQEDKNDDK